MAGEAFVIYGLQDPVSGQLRYVGRTHQRLSRRVAQHLDVARRGRRTACANWIRKLIASGRKPVAIVIDEGRGAQESADMECEYIALARMAGVRLLNHTAGGEGIANPDAEARRRMSQAQKGKRQSEETKRRRSEKHAGELSHLAKLTDAQVEEIYLLYGGRRGEQTSLAKRYGVTSQRIGQIVREGRYGDTILK